MLFHIFKKGNLNAGENISTVIEKNATETKKYSCMKEASTIKIFP